MSKTTLFDSRIKKYAYREESQIYQDIGASSDGLSHEQVEVMREKYGANCFAGRKNDTMLHRLRRAFINPFNVILFILGIISLVTDVLLVSDFSKNASTAIIIFSMILISGTIRLIQELRAKNAAQQLDRLIHESITVRREGELIEIPAEKLVVGDIVLLSAGDRVPADIRITRVTDLFVSQAAITGESAILEKSSRTLSYGNPETLTQLENLAFMATTVISGKGEGIVLAVGKDTLYGSFAKLDSEDKKAFQQGANSIAWVYVNGGFDTRKSVKTAEKGAKIGLSEVKSTLDSPFLTILLCNRDRPAGKVVTLAVTDFAIIKMCEEKLKGATH